MSETFRCPNCDEEHRSLLHFNAAGKTCLSEYDRLRMARTFGVPIDPATLLAVRPELARFAIAMEKTLAKNDHKGGWEESEQRELLANLAGELCELLETYVPRELLETYVPRERVEEIDLYNVGREASRLSEDLELLDHDPVPNEETASEAVDLANFALMIWGNATRRVRSR